MSSAFLIALAGLASSFVSGVFGMAGGLLLMGVLAATLPAAQALALHGAIQLVSNGSRSVFLSRYIKWRVIGYYAAGALATAAAAVFIALSISKAALFLAMGFTPLLIWVPKRFVLLDISKPAHAVAAGVSVTGLSVVAGVAGPWLEMFFARAALDRRAIVASKSMAMVISHSVKLIYFGAPLALGAADAARELALLFLLVAPLSVLGNWLGGKVLNAMSEAAFSQWTKWIVTALGCVYIVRGLMLL